MLQILTRSQVADAQISKMFSCNILLTALLFIAPRLTDKVPKEYAVYRCPLLFWGLVDLVYDMFRVNTPLGHLTTPDGQINKDP